MATRGRTKDFESGVAASRGQRDLPGVEHGSGGKQLVSRAGLGALGHDVLARLEGAGREQADLARFCCRSARRARTS